MNKVFLLQIVVSFFVGGGFIAFLTFWAEKASSRVAGIIMSLPSTVAIGYFFIAITVSPQAVADIAPMVPLGAGILMMFTIVYLYTSRLPLKKPYSVALSTFLSLLVWFLMAVPLAIYKFNNIWISVFAYLFFLAIGLHFLTIRNKFEVYHKPLFYSVWEKLFRACFIGGIIALIVFLSKTLGTFWGGIFTLFPAIFLSSMVIFHIKYDSNFLFKVWKNSPVGSLVFVSFAIASIYTFPTFGPYFGLLGSYFVAFLAYEVVSHLKVG